MNRRVVITGVGAVSPLGIGADTLIDRWTAGESGISGGLGACREFEPLEHLTKKEARRSDRFTQMAVVSADEALELSGFGTGEDEELPYPSERIGCIIGTGIGGIGSLQEQDAVLRERGPKAVSPLAVPLMMGNAASAAVAMRFGLKGETYGVMSACAAGAHAIGSATRLIESGRADAAVAGGAESAMIGIALAAFASMGATSPTGISRPFDARRDGFVMGEGAGILVLEEAEAAEARGAEVIGEITGYAATCDASHLTAPDPAGTQSARAISTAIEEAGLEPGDLDYINAHGTSTTLNDSSETRALKVALGSDAYGIPISSTKSVIGHLMGAGGAVEAVATILTLKQGIAPPTVGLEEPDEELDLDYIPGEARPLTAKNERLTAISNSFGFGGHNAVLCFRGA
ncbi:MAG: beta-ketoacyl-ACP synthase II [Thermoleophilia bacterium]|nr:beta-ketoacyl-ACP synthase II [Thermoleophilia bacterium]